MSRPRWQQPKLQTRTNKDATITYWWEWTEYGRDPDGTERRRHRSQTVPPLEGSSEARATRYFQRWLREHKAEPVAEEWTVERLAVMWFETRRRSWSRNMRINVLTSIDRHILPRFRAWRVSEIKPMHINAWLGTMADSGMASGTAKQILWAFRSIMETAVDNELITRNPAKKIQPPRSMPERVKTQTYTIDEIDAMLASHTGQDNLILRVLLFCGLRPGEVCALRRGDLLEGGALQVDESTDGGQRYKSTKTRKTRIVPVPPDLWHDLCEHAHGVPSDDAPLFPNRRGEMFDPGWLWERLGVNLRRCRCTFASLIDADPADVRDLVGHTDVETTMEHYRRGLPDRQRRAVADLERRVTRKPGKVIVMGEK